MSSRNPVAGTTICSCLVGAGGYLYCRRALWSFSFISSRPASIVGAVICRLGKSGAYRVQPSSPGVHRMLVFLAVNGIELAYDQQELIDIIWQVASGQAKADDLLVWILEHQV